MKNTLRILLVVLFFGHQIHAQETKNINEKVFSTSKQPIEGATLITEHS
ncbi:hypothetical protein [Thalassobellus suaedae]|uniref:Uncharacterized protein n=1 Tax=Thalassobellus suaedae TaxID=3074124 RepID=A0ABY9XT85_9FLAO|nr:hypothetical protein RHP51_18620 [Flavobacteriaceae bacterium HL-DH14]